MITPSYLMHGDTIGIFAPSRGISRDELKGFQSWATRHGFQLKYGKNLFGALHQFSGTDRERTEDVNDLLRDPEVSAIIAARGGYGSARILEDLDLSRISSQPKWLIGFSDVTALHCAVNRLSRVESLHSWMPVSLGAHNKYDELSCTSLNLGLTGNNLFYETDHHPLNVPGKASGELTGGNLSVLISLAGTIYEPEYEGKILFLEDVDEYLYHIDRMILNLELRGVLQKISGLVVGAFSGMKDNEVSFGKTAYEIISGWTAHLGFPILFGFPAGHDHQNHTLILGREATLIVDETQCSLTFSK